MGYRKTIRWKEAGGTVRAGYEYNSARNLVEAAIVAESLVRIQKPSDGANGYYAQTSVHGNSPYERYMYDRETLAGNGTAKGRRAERRLEQRFEDTSISHLGYYRPGSNAGKYLGERKAKGTLPVAVKPLPKKKAPAIAGPTVPGTGPVGAEASKNKMRTKAKR